MKIIKTLARFKNYLARSNGYISLATFGLVLWNLTPNWWFAPLIIFGVLGMLYLGHIDYKIGLYKEEQRWVAGNNPELMEIKRMIGELKNG